MGVMRFLVPDRQRIPTHILQKAYIASLESVPWRCHVEATDNGFQLQRSVSESGTLHIPWLVQGFGEPLLSTASLMERDRPYLLPVELARGTLNALRNQLATWRQAGLQATEEFDEHSRRAAHAFASAATFQSELLQCTSAAQTCIEISLEGLQKLAEAYIQQALALRHDEQPKLSTFLGSAITAGAMLDKTAASLLPACNTVAIAMPWKQMERQTGQFDWQETDRLVEWARKQGLRVIGGPLLSFDEATLPDWLYLWEGEYDDLQSYVRSWVQQAVQRYQGQVNLWHVTARLNSGQVLSLDEDQRLKLSVDALECVRRFDRRTPTIVSFDQPWAEYMARSGMDIAPIQYADALARADLGLSGLGLEINYGYWPGTLPRCLISVSRMLDSWSMLGMPVVVFLTAASRRTADPAARQPVDIVPGPLDDDVSPATHCKLIGQLVQMMLCKHSVHGVIYNQLSDAAAHELPHAGLFDQQNHPRPALSALADIRQQHLL